MGGWEDGWMKRWVDKKNGWKIKWVDGKMGE